MKKNEAIITDNISSMIMQSLHDLYVEHPHECNLIDYAGLSIAAYSAFVIQCQPGPFARQ